MFFSSVRFIVVEQMIRGRARPQAGYAAAQVLGQTINGKLLKEVNGLSSRFSNFMFAYGLSPRPHA